ncbi:glycogen synthase GlgA [Bordetella sp. BOR01]|uniref:glycogen synthase GlgA n=1 Tax=Bordetella sp. BOR01 TaxID=2854779 RepID=UPI001C4771D4|nr:glycogen synthase GlgA [Bordetella sp. BOR01]MBV7486124.1 glycogen synthase GlgA [Bordetella sp. BOR01]
MARTRSLMVASEAFPLAKSGGLGDAVTGLAQALSRADTEVGLLMPAYRGVRERVVGTHHIAHLAGMPGGEATLVGALCPESGLPVYLLCNDALYDRHGLYQDEHGQPYADNALRYAALAHAAVRMAGGLPGARQPDILHAQDWHAGLVPLLVRAAGLRYVKTVFTVHNLAFQGMFPLACARELGIPESYCTDDGARFYDQLSFLKAGLRYADRITTVSRNYAREILTPEFGCGLDPLLRARAADLVPIPNGIDDILWNPASDPHLGRIGYSARKPAGKTQAKRALQNALGLHVERGAALLAMGSRLTEQKMADVAVQALPAAMERHPGLQVAVIGCGDHRYEQALVELAARYPGRCAVRIGYDEGIAHRLHAGADMLLHGSRFEPFGLTPLYAMRYGAVPIGSRVGGMADTIVDPGELGGDKAMLAATGVLFDGDSPHDMGQAIDRALRLYAQPAVWRCMQRNGMACEFGWDMAARPYIDLFASLAGASPRGQVPAPTIRPEPVPAYARHPLDGGIPVPLAY